MVNKAGTIEMSPSKIFINAVNLLQLGSKGVKVIVHRFHINKHLFCENKLSYRLDCFSVYLEGCATIAPGYFFLLLFYFIFKIQY